MTPAGQSEVPTARLQPHSSCCHVIGTLYESRHKSDGWKQGGTYCALVADSESRALSYSKRKHDLACRGHVSRHNHVHGRSRALLEVLASPMVQCLALSIVSHGRRNTHISQLPVSRSSHHKCLLAANDVATQWITKQPEASDLEPRGIRELDGMLVFSAVERRFVEILHGRPSIAQRTAFTLFIVWSLASFLYLLSSYSSFHSLCQP